MNKKPSIFLTGGSGLLAVNWYYSVKSHFSVYLGLNERIITPYGCNALKININTVKSIFHQLEEIRPSVIIHTAGLTSVEKCEINPDLAHFINVELSINVANAAKLLGIPFVHISTDHLFDGTSSMLSEDVPINPVNVYGITKALAEKSVLEINPDSLIIRTNFYCWGTSYRESFSDQIIRSLRSKQSIDLFEDVKYTPILAENLIRTVHELLEIKASGIYHVVSDDIISKYDFGIIIADEFGLDMSLINKSSFRSKSNLVKRPADMSLSNQKVSELLGKNLGTVKQHVANLRLQELEAKTQEIKLL
jgi:dTDP-4-dehydrorhamnose reductase